MSPSLVPSWKRAQLASPALLFFASLALGCARESAPHASIAKESARQSASVAFAAAPVTQAAPAAPSSSVGGGSASAATPRRVIRTADLTLESDAPDSLRAKAGALVAARDGFVVSSDTSSDADGDGTRHTSLTLVLRVPEPAFDATLGGLRELGSHVLSEKVTGQDVTEEYVDVEARLRAQRAIEDQYLAILKDAHAIPDVLAVEQKLGEVRTEIERAEGRRRYLESQSSLATVTVHVTHTSEAVGARGSELSRTVHEAAGDALATATAIMNGVIRGAGVLGPIAILVWLPLYALARLWRRRRAPPVAA